MLYLEYISAITVKTLWMVSYFCQLMVSCNCNTVFLQSIYGEKQPLYHAEYAISTFWR